MHKAKHRAIFQLLLAVVLGTIVGVAFWLAFDRVNERRTQVLVDTHIREIVAMLDLADLPDFHRRIDKVRTFINDNSEHEIDDEFFANRKNRASFAAGVLDHAKGLSADPVNMECSTRSNLMRDILHALGHQTRKLRTYLDIISITEKGGESRYALYTSRTDLNRIYQKDGEEGLFCEVEEKRCKHGFFNISQYRETR